MIHPVGGVLGIRGTLIAYSDVGAGPVVLRAHGLSQSRAADEAAGLYDFSPVADEFRLISYDARGHGKSGGDTVAEQYTWAELAMDMLALADHFSPDAPVSVIGTSMGTATALHAVSARPDRVERLVLTAPPTAWETRAGQTDMYAQLADLVEAGSADAVAEIFGQVPVAPIFADVPGYPPVPDVSHALLPSVFRGAGVSDLPDPDTLRRITQPTLILPWATDPGHPLSTAERLGELIADSRTVVANSTDDMGTWGRLALDFLAGR